MLEDYMETPSGKKFVCRVCDAESYTQPTYQTNSPNAGPMRIGGPPVPQVTVNRPYFECVVCTVHFSDPDLFTKEAIK